MLNLKEIRNVGDLYFNDLPMKDAELNYCNNL